MDECTRKVMEMYSNPLFKKEFFDFFIKMQQEGIEAAKKFWGISYGANMFPNAMEFYEKLVDFYIVLGFIPRAKYDEVVKENEKLKHENTFLRDTIKQLQMKVFTEGGQHIQESWQNVIDKQFDMNKEIAKNFFDLFRQLKVSAE